MLADERKDFQPVDQLFAVLVRFFALAVCSEQQILELVLDGVKGIVAFEELPRCLGRHRLAKPEDRLIGAAVDLLIVAEDHIRVVLLHRRCVYDHRLAVYGNQICGGIGNVKLAVPHGKICAYKLILFLRQAECVDAIVLCH